MLCDSEGATSSQPKKMNGIIADFLGLGLSLVGLVSPPALDQPLPPVHALAGATCTPGETRHHQGDANSWRLYHDAGLNVSLQGEDTLVFWCSEEGIFQSSQVNLQEALASCQAGNGSAFWVGFSNPTQVGVALRFLSLSEPFLTFKRINLASAMQRKSRYQAYGYSWILEGVVVDCNRTPTPTH